MKEISLKITIKNPNADWSNYLMIKRWTYDNKDNTSPISREIWRWYK